MLTGKGSLNYPGLGPPKPSLMATLAPANPDFFQSGKFTTNCSGKHGIYSEPGPGVALHPPFYSLYLSFKKSTPNSPENRPHNYAAMKISYKMTLLILLAALFLGSAKKADPLPQAKELVDLTLQFDNVAGNTDLVLNSVDYTNVSGESFNVSQLQYFVSNMKFVCPNGKEFKVNQDDSYFLIQEHEPVTQTLKLKVPAGEYNKLTFLVGVDSLRNTMPIDKRKGVLDPSNSMDNGMYWSWNSGYIFFKMEGNSAAAREDPTGNRRFRYHIGGFGGYSARTINNIKSYHPGPLQRRDCQGKEGQECNHSRQGRYLKNI